MRGLPSVSAVCDSVRVGTEREAWRRVYGDVFALALAALALEAEDGG